MSRSPFAVLACTGFLVEGVLVVANREFAFTGRAYDHFLDASYAVAMIGCAVAVHGVAATVGAPRFGRIAARVASAGFAAMALESAVAAVHRIDALGPLFALGIAAAVLGCLVLAFAGRIAPRWLAALPLAAMVLTAAGGEVGASLLSAGAWALLSHTLQPTGGGAMSALELPHGSRATP